MPAIDFVTARAPELVQQVTPAIIAIADSMTGGFSLEMIGTLGTKRDYAVALRALHIVAMNARRGSDGDGSSGGGFIGSETEGSLSRSYQIDQNDLRKFGDLNYTTWGQELIMLIKNSFVRAITRMMPLHPNGTIATPSDYET